MKEIRLTRTRIRGPTKDKTANGELTDPRYRGGLGLRRGGVRRRSGDLSSRCEWRSDDFARSSFVFSSLVVAALPSSASFTSVSDSATSTSSDSGTGMFSTSRRWLSFLMRRFIRFSFYHPQTHTHTVHFPELPQVRLLRISLTTNSKHLSNVAAKLCYKPDAIPMTQLKMANWLKGHDIEGRSACLC